MMMNSDLTHVFVMGNQRAINHHSSETNGSIDTWINSTKCNYIWVQYIWPHIKDPAIKWWNVDCFKPNLVIPMFFGSNSILFSVPLRLTHCSMWVLRDVVLKQRLWATGCHIYPWRRGSLTISLRAPKRSLYIDGVMGPYINCFNIIFINR